MGITASAFSRSGDHRVSDFTDPSQTNWITAHLETCIMPVPEVLRCWQRYVALGADKNGNVPLQSLIITDDPFSAKLVQQLAVSGEDLVSFLTFCSAVNWLAKSTVNDTLRGLHQALPPPTPDQEVLAGMLSALYPQDPPEGVRHLASLTMRETDVKKQGFIDETQFIWWMRRLPMETLKSLLHFSALPDGKEENPSPGGDHLGVASEESLDAQFNLIAMEMAKWMTDWRLLANCHGFLERECRTFERENKGQEKQWQRGAKKRNAAEELQAALRDSGNTDIHNLVFRLAF